MVRGKITIFIPIVLLILQSISSAEGRKLNQSIDAVKRNMVANKTPVILASDNDIDRIGLNDFGRTLSSMSSMGNKIGDLISNITMLLSGSNLGNVGNSSCQSNIGIMEGIKVPLFIITPAVIIGVIILIKIIGLIVAWIPSRTAPFFKSLMNLGKDNDSSEGGYEGGYGWPMPSSGYGAPASPSSYGAPNLSRQTAILDAIDNLSNQYGQAQNQNRSPDFGQYYPYSSNPGNSNAYPNDNPTGNSGSAPVDDSLGQIGQDTFYYDNQNQNQIQPSAGISGGSSDSSLSLAQMNSNANYNSYPTKG